MDTSLKLKKIKIKTQKCFLKLKKKKKRKEKKPIQKKKKKIKEQTSQHVNKKRKNQRKKKKKANTLEVKSNGRGIFESSFHELSHLCFLFILGRKLFGRSREKTPGSHHLFSFLHTQPSTLQKSFPFHFLSKIFHPSYFTSKQTHPKMWFGWKNEKVKGLKMGKKQKS